MRPDKLTLTLTAPLLGAVLVTSLLGCGGGGSGSGPSSPAPDPVATALAGRTWRVTSISGAGVSVPTCPGTATAGFITFTCGADDRVTFHPDGTQVSVGADPTGAPATTTGTWSVSGSALTVVNTAVTPPDPTLTLPDTTTSSVTLTDATHFTATSSGVTYAFQQQ